MIEKSELTKVIESAIEGSELFLVDVAISRDNNIVVEIDSMDCVSIDDCAKLTKAIESHFDRDTEDYELEVGSAGLTSPFKVKRQYEKYIDEEVEVLTKDGRKIKGILKEVAENNFVISTTKKVKPEGAKRPIQVCEDETFNYDEIKYTKYLIQFK
ncbi:MAG: ribosome assembly cofactor RimP [Bacteroidales bacterium]|nr:ribosome assembly cofactor RimP [Bacteroidales bacterium]